MTTLIDLNTARWNKCSVNPERQSEFNSVATRLTAAKARYQEVEKLTGVPWWFIAVVHEREASQDWNANLAQGDPWNKKSTHVPKGRGPFASWKDAAVDALVNCPPYTSKNKDWSVGNALTLLETYNGLGYSNKGIPSPYIWAGTNQYTKGKYVSDGVFSPLTVDKQLGCAGLLKTMKVYDMPVAEVVTSTVGSGATLATYLTYGLEAAVVIGAITLVTVLLISWIKSGSTSQPTN